MKLLISTAINDENVDFLTNWLEEIYKLPIPKEVYVSDNRKKGTLNDAVHKVLKSFQHKFGMIYKKINSKIPQVELIYHSEARNVDLFVFWDVTVPVKSDSLIELINYSLIKPTAPYVFGKTKHVLNTKHKLLAENFDGLKTVDSEELVLPNYVFGINRNYLSKLKDTFTLPENYDTEFSVYLCFSQVGIKFETQNLIV